jgi:Protein of unknown function (DUF3500)
MDRSPPIHAGRVGIATIALSIMLFGVPASGNAQRPNLDEPFVGVTTDGNVVPNLFPIRATGVSTRPILDAARAYLATLTPEQLDKTRFDLESSEWRNWSNVPIANMERAGLPFREMTGPQREAAFNLVRSGLSARGFEQARDIMRLDGYLAQALDNPDGYGEDLYYIDIFGEPSETEPWGWQLDGHHLVVNYFVMGDQVVMTPDFWGAEPTHLDTPEYPGIDVLQVEQDTGLDFVNSLRADQRAIAIVESEKTGNDQQAAAFRDNLVLDYAGIRGDRLDDAQREALMSLIGVWVGTMREDQAQIRMDEVRQYLDETRFAWIGETGPESLFYYRIQSPVILVEFDHTVPVSFPVRPPVPSRTHIHAVVRTPNGNDYGRDLLKEHYEMTANDPNHQHR